MRQTIHVVRAGGYDDYGPIPGAEFDLKCRIDEGSHLVVEHSSGTVTGETAVAEARIMLDKLADIKYGDTLSWTNELGVTTSRKPKKIDVKRGNSGKPMLTEVSV